MAAAASPPPSGDPKDGSSATLESLLKDETASLAAHLWKTYAGTAHPQTRDVTFDLVSSSSSSSSSATTTRKHQAVQVPGWIRERCAEIFFEDEDPDGESIGMTILQTVLHVSARSF